MTQAQKTAKANFKKAIEYRKKTGVSLKEAFAHVYGKKVGAVKKSVGAITLNKAKEIASRWHSGQWSAIYQFASSGIITKENYSRYLNELEKDLKFADTTKDKKELKQLINFIEKEYKRMYTGKKVGAVKKKAAPKKKAVKKSAKSKVLQIMKQKGASAKSYDKRHQALPPGIRISRRTGKKYKEVRANRSDKGVLLGIGNVDDIYRDYKLTNKKLLYATNAIKNYKESIKNTKNPIFIEAFKNKIKHFTEYSKELKKHKEELKKIIYKGL
jgi:hypothetical protein